jgi:zinc transport system ATP-binding protein
MSLITASGLEATLDGRIVLKDVTFSIDRAEIVTVVGPNGSGKTTLIRMLIGALKPSRGTILTEAGIRIGYVPQKLNVDATLPLTVGRFLNLPVHRSEEARLSVLTRVGIEGLADRQISELSGGQFQRALLARALLHEPDILVLDEPTQGLDQPGIAAFYKLIETVRTDLGCAILLVSHDLHVVMSASDRVLCLNGHICCEGTPHVVSAAPEYRALFGHGTGGTMALYQHEHDHSHATGHHHHHDHDHGDHDA